MHVIVHKGYVYQEDAALLASMETPAMTAHLAREIYLCINKHTCQWWLYCMT